MVLPADLNEQLLHIMIRIAQEAGLADGQRLGGRGAAQLQRHFGQSGDDRGRISAHHAVIVYR